MIAEVEVLVHVDDIVEVVPVFPLYYIQDLQLNQCLVVKPADLQLEAERKETFPCSESCILTKIV